MSCTHQAISGSKGSHFLITKYHHLLPEGVPLNSVVSIRTYNSAQESHAFSRCRVIEVIEPKTETLVISSIFDALSEKLEKLQL